MLALESTLPYVLAIRTDYPFGQVSSLGLTKPGDQGRGLSGQVVGRLNVYYKTVPRACWSNGALALETANAVLQKACFLEEALMASRGEFYATSIALELCLKGRVDPHAVRRKQRRGRRTQEVSPGSGPSPGGF